MTDEIEDVDFDGPGPFAIPLLARFEGLDLPGHMNFGVAEFQFEDGSSVHVPISIQAAVGLAAAMRGWVALHAEVEAKDKTKH